eukprot:jgi/Tetstr1/421996/TSEL_001240.t1
MLEARVVAPTQNVSHKLADVHDFPAVKAILENDDKEISGRNKLWVPEMEAYAGQAFDVVHRVLQLVHPGLEVELVMIEEQMLESRPLASLQHEHSPCLLVWQM